MKTTLTFNEDLRTRMKAGVDILANAVKATLGPGGRNVIIRPDMPPHTPKITKDGVTVADIINLEDKFEDMGAQIVKMAAKKTHSDAGDGTTTSTLLAQVIITEGLKKLETGANPVDIKRGMDKAVSEVVKCLQKQSKPITDGNLIQIATIAANNEPEIGKTVADAIKQTGKDGVIYLQRSKTIDTHIELTEGIQIDRGWTSPYFVSNPAKMTVELENPFILFAERKISNLKDIQPILEFALSEKRPLLIIAEEVDGDAMSTIVTNALIHNVKGPAGGFKLAVIKQPGFGAMQLQMNDDVAIMTGGIVMSETRGHTWIKVDKTFFGYADKVVITQHKTSIIGAGCKDKKVKKATEGRIEEIRALIEGTTDNFEKDKLKKLRLAKLTNGTGIIHVGGQTDVEISEKIDRVDDALKATYAAIAEGVVPGGGLSFLKCIQSVELLLDSDMSKDELTGVEIIKEALEGPARQILLNAGKNADDILTQLIGFSKGGAYGYNSKSGAYEDFFETGIIDPCKVSRVAIENASSVGGMFLTTAAGIVDDPNK